MLVLSRKIDQTIVIGGSIRVVVLGIGSKRATIGFDAPDNVPISRQESGHRDRPVKAGKKAGGMLVLSRKEQEGALIGGDILVTVLGIERDRVKIGTRAPSNVRVVRGELITEGAEGGPRSGSKERF